MKRSEFNTEAVASGVKVYLHTLPLGGFIRAVEERDYLVAVEEVKRLKIQKEIDDQLFWRTVDENKRLISTLQEIVDRKGLGVIRSSEKIAAEALAQNAEGGE